MCGEGRLMVAPAAYHAHRHLPRASREATTAMVRIKEEDPIDLTDSPPLPSNKRSRNVQLLEEAFGIGGAAHEIEEPYRKLPRPYKRPRLYSHHIQTVQQRDRSRYYQDIDEPDRHTEDSRALDYNGIYSRRVFKGIDVLERTPFADPRAKGDNYVGDIRAQIQELQDFLVQETGARFSAYRIYDEIGVENLHDPFPSDYERQFQWLYRFVVNERLILKTPDTIRYYLDNQFGADKILADAIRGEIDGKFATWKTVIEAGNGEKSDDLSGVMCQYVYDISRLSYVGERGLQLAWDLIIYLGTHTYSSLESGGVGFGYRPSDIIIDGLCCELAKRRRDKKKGWKPVDDFNILLNHATSLSMCFWSDLTYPGECALFRKSIDLLESYVEGRLISGEENLLLNYDDL
ncbi:hypothetical protein HYALB_00001518 [Hymenoscyphus albidus]|uniref:Uncharacterized protein n=1 Tax=Hymenoscyphus albidus TaxID=595503 RepID=A0A9N9LDZ6_9HELO|nr:hypothetical protein HYALB_00001518 [Hymenoscyphus albidus]